MKPAVGGVKSDSDDDSSGGDDGGGKSGRVGGARGCGSVGTMIGPLVQGYQPSVARHDGAISQTAWASALNALSGRRRVPALANCDRNVCFWCFGTIKDDDRGEMQRIWCCDCTDFSFRPPRAIVGPRPAPGGGGGGGGGSGGTAGASLSLIQPPGSCQNTHSGIGIFLSLSGNRYGFPKPTTATGPHIKPS